MTITTPYVRVMMLAGATLPQYESAGAAGIDLSVTEGGLIYPGGRQIVGTGLCFEIPPGFEGQVRPRSGLAAKHGITIVNSPGTIDSDYRGEVKLILLNTGKDTFRFEPGDRLAQMVFAPVVQAQLIQVWGLSETERGEKGFGSTGITTLDASKLNISSLA